MCQFFSFVTDGQGGRYYLNWDYRKSHFLQDCDSHSIIADVHGFKGKLLDTLNKYEYNPLTKEFTVDQINNEVDDRFQAEEWVRELDFKNVIEPLIIKDIVNPLLLKPKKVTKKDIENLKKWNSIRNSIRNSVWDSVWDSIRNSVRDSVWNSVGDSVRNFVWASVWASVWTYVWASVRDSVGDSVGTSVGDSVRDSVVVYISSFFNIKCDYDFSSLNELWNRGFVPSFDGTTWRLHSGKDAKIVYEMKKGRIV